MAVTYGYFNSVDGDRRYNADQMSEYFDGLVSNGVYEDVGGGLQVVADSGMNVNVNTGRGLIDCKWIKNDAVLSLAVTAAHVTLNRYTAVVLRLDYTNRLIEIDTKDGTPASSPTKPDMQDDQEAKELCLAYIYVKAGATSITQSAITDMRASELCGWVTGVIKQVDTSELFIQWQTAYEEQYEAFEAWFATLTDQLRVDTYIQRFAKRFVVSANSGNVVELDMTGYVYDSSDVINVYVNGLYAVQGVDYTLTVTEGVVTIQPNASAVGTDIGIVVLKSKIGYHAMTDALGNNVVDSNNQEIAI